MKRTVSAHTAAAGLLLTLVLAAPAEPQYAPGEQMSPNMRLVSHLPLGGDGEVNDLEVEQELSRPYVYVSRRSAKGFHIVNIREPERPALIYTWTIENAPLHQGRSLDAKYFKLDDRYYLAQSFQFSGGGPDRDLGAIIFDVTGLPDVSTVREVMRIRAPEAPGGFHNLFAYKHSDGRVLLFATVVAPRDYPYGVHVYDMAALLAGDPDQGLIGGVPLPEPRGAADGYHDAYVAYDHATGQDKFYGGGPEVSYLGGNYVYDVSDPADPQLLASVLGQEGQQSGGHTFVAGPHHRYVFTEMTSPAHAPIQAYDLQPALEGDPRPIKRPIGAWTADWRKSSHNMEIRWPYMFVSAYEDGIQVVDIQDPARMRTVAFYDTYDVESPYVGGGVANGVFGIDVRNSDGLIVASDMQSGFWAVRMDGFSGWDGRQWGIPNVSTVQDWDNGPVASNPPST